MSLNMSLSTRSTLEILDTVLAGVHPFLWCSFRVAVACVAVWILFPWLRTSRWRVRTTRLRGPPSESFLYGVGKCIVDTEDPGAVYEAWAEEYGPVFEVPSALGSRKILLCDPKAIAHFYAKEAWTYIKTPFARKVVVRMFGKGLTLAEGENHKRKRRSLAPAFSISAVRQLTPIFYDSAYKAKGAWDVLIESTGEGNAIIDVQKWMNHIALDIIGLAGFSHNFGALEGKRAYVTEALSTLGSSSSSITFDNVIFLLGMIFPLLAKVPTSRTKLFQELNTALEDIASMLLARSQKEMEMGTAGRREERSVVELIITGEGERNNLEPHSTKDEVVSQIKQLLFAAYETMSITLTWAFLELARTPDVQTKLRNELIEYGADPTYDQLTNGLPYLDAVVHEVLRLHPAVIEFIRIAVEDDVIPLSEPIRTKSGELVNSLTIAKGTLVSVSVESINRSAAIWGEDAKVFQPNRWLEDAEGRNGIPAKTKEIQGYRHLLTFADGQRACLGKNFALAEFKAVLTVLVKNFVFELRGGADSKIEISTGVIPRPKLAGEVGCKLPLRVKPYVA